MVVCQECGCVFCWDDADEGTNGGRKLYCSETCKHRSRPAYRRRRRRERQRQLCKRQNKACYDTELIAVTMARLLRGRQRWSMYPYECACGSWHLTKQPPDSRPMADALKRALAGAEEGIVR